MHIGRPRHNSEQKYYMRGQLLESVKEEKDLGIMVVQRHESFTAML